jgi:hypothetical protein
MVVMPHSEEATLVRVIPKSRVVSRSYTTNVRTAGRDEITADEHVHTCD